MRMRQLPNWLLAIVGTVGWRCSAIRQTTVAEVERRWPAVFLSTLGNVVIVRVRRRRLFGYQWPTLALLLGAYLLLAHYGGIAPALAVLVLIHSFHFVRQSRRRRPEAAWCISHNGTRELWNDGPQMLHRYRAPLLKKDP